MDILVLQELSNVLQRHTLTGSSILVENEQGNLDLTLLEGEQLLQSYESLLWDLPKFNALALFIEIQSQNSAPRFLALTPSADMPLNINGMLNLTGMVTLMNKDCLIFDNSKVFIDDSLSAIPYLSESSDNLPCAYCGEEIEAGDLIVTCSSCGLTYHHDSHALDSCWLANAKCFSCGTSTSLNEVSSWMPEGFASCAVVNHHE
jgi:hypothetical protein